jgi:glycopeptide antibiotics resistance protein
LPKKNILYGITGLIAVILGFLGKTVYRDFIRLHNVSDFGVSGFLPSLFYVAGFSLLLLMRPTRFPVAVITIVTTASLLFELEQYLSAGNFDIADSIATISGGIIAFLTLKLIAKET